MNFFRLIVLLTFLSNTKTFAAAQDADSLALMEVKQMMALFYIKMRKLDLSWMEYLSADADAVAHGKFLDHLTFIEAERNFFNSLSNLEITVLKEPIYRIIKPDVVLVSLKHSIATTLKNGYTDKNRIQVLTFIWKKQADKWYIVFSHFGDTVN